MGVNVSLLNPITMTDDPRWDCGRHAGDRLISRAVEDHGGVRPKELDDFDHVWTVPDPTGIAATMSSLVRHEYGCEANEDRWRLLEDLLREGLLVEVSR